MAIVNCRGFLEAFFTSAKSEDGSEKYGMRIAYDLSIFLEHPALLLLLVFLAVLIGELLRALGS